MTDPGRGGGRLEVDADLRVDLTDAAGASAVARVRADAGTMRIEVDHPEVALGALPRLGDTSRALGTARELGLKVEVHGPRGRLAAFDPDRPSRIVGLVTGEPALRATPAAVGAWVRGPGRRVAVFAGVVTAVLAAVGALVARPRREGRATQPPWTGRA